VFSRPTSGLSRLTHRHICLDALISAFAEVALILTFAEVALTLTFAEVALL
jgi:hypothetical protein